MDLSNLNAALGSPWAIAPTWLPWLREVARGKPAAAAPGDGGRPAPGRNGSIAIIPVMGPLLQRVSPFEARLGFMSMEGIGLAVDRAAADKGTTGILFVFDSPGGTVAGTPELAAKIRAASQQKKTVAFVDPMAASAAYWLATQASEIVVSTAGNVGSIGVVIVLVDDSEAMKNEGLDLIVVASAKYKGEGYLPPTPELRQHLQASVDTYHTMFTQAVAGGRRVAQSTVESTFGQGRMVLAGDAIKRGMADRLGTLESTLAGMGAGNGTGIYLAAGKSRNAAIASARVRAIKVEEEVSVPFDREQDEESVRQSRMRARALQVARKGH